MATILNDAAYMALPMNIKRGNPIPLDTTAVWYNKTELENYAKTGATAYVGQVLTLVAGGKCEAYMISNEAGTLVKLAQTTATGDLASDVANLQTQVEGLVEKVGSAAAEGTEASGLYKLIADVEAVAKARLESVEAGDNSVTIAGSATKPSVAVKVSKAAGNALSLADDGLKVEIPEVKVPKYSLVKDEKAANGDIATYHLTKDGVNEGVAINIPKDLVVSSGSVETFTAGALPEGVTEAGTYIKLTLANNDKPLYINVSTLIEYVTGGSGENDAIQINVSSDTHKVTANVKEGSLTKEMLAAGVVASLGKADTAVQTVAAGDTKGTIKVDGTEIAVAGLKDAAFATVESINATAQGYVDTAKAALEGNDATDNENSATIVGAKKYADKVAKTASDNADAALTNKIAGLKNTDEAVANQFVTAVKETNGVVTVERKALVAADIPELGVSKITGLQGLLDGKQDTLTFDGGYSAGVNNVATVSTVNTAKSDLIGDTSAEAATTDGNTIADVRRYVNAKTEVLASNEALTQLSNKVTANTNSIETINTSLAEGGSVSNAIADAKKAGTDAATAVSTLENGKVKANTEAIAAINNTETGILKQAKNYADGKDTAIAAAKKAGDDAAAAVTTLKNGEVKANADAITAINNKIGTIPDGRTVAQAIEDAKTAATYDDTGVKELIKNNKDAIDVLNGGDTIEGSVAKSVKDAINDFSNKISDDGTVNTFKELVDYVAAHGSEYTDAIADITANKSAIDTLNGTGTGSVSKAVSDAIDGLHIGDYAKSADVESTYVKKNGTDRLITAAEGTKLAGIAEGAQVNVIESIKLNGTALSIDAKAVNIPLVTADTAGIVISSADENTISYANGIGTVNSLNVNKLAQTEGDVLIIDGGKA